MNKKFIIIAVLLSAATVGAVSSFFLMKDEKADAPPLDMSMKPVEPPLKHIDRNVTAATSNQPAHQGGIQDSASPVQQTAAENPVVHAPSESKPTHDKSSVRSQSEAVLREAISNFDDPFTEEEKSAASKDPAYKDWIVEIDAKIGAEISDAQRRELIAGQLELVALRTKLQSEYLSEKIDWKTYANALQALSTWGDAPYQDVLNGELYEKLNGFKKEDFKRALNVLTPPSSDEAFVLFPVITQANPKMNSDDLDQLVPRHTTEALISLKKQNMIQQNALQKNFDAGKITEDEFMTGFQTLNAEFTMKAEKLLSPEEMNIFFPQPQKAEAVPHVQ